MGIRLAMSPHLFRLMSPEDQARYGAVPDSAPIPHLDSHPLPKTGTAEKKEQGTSASWLLLQNNRLHFTTKGSCLSFADD